ncbi:lipoyl synthase [Estrella lausannensis]|uniref:Lipoyl synthase n=1 Tax=Estrella lausannensis TaxID=483423 RepID=A0A0H5E2G6_9BACT|nr:lipoyl synthase [Estrella lausannensis]CRX37380.1 Lipoyl synthase [Estrella lausannensis]
MDNKLTFLGQRKQNKLNILPENPERPVEDKPLGRFPSWLHRKLPRGGDLFKTGSLLEKSRLSTVCEEAKCPNLFECWSKKTATFLIMGKECTRACGFCDIDFSKTPKSLEADEPDRIVESVKALSLKHVVITMVARDDLSDQGASHIVKVVEALRKDAPECTIELLTSDFNGDMAALETTLNAGPDIFNHNIETVRRLSPRVRHRATYERTLLVLSHAKKAAARLGKQIFIKSGIMVGLGEDDHEVLETLKDLKEAEVDIVTIGQYLQASQKKLLVKRFVTPEQFKEYESTGLKMGIPYIFSGPFVRSSYNAESVMKAVKDNTRKGNEGR